MYRKKGVKYDRILFEILALLIRSVNEKIIWQNSKLDLLNPHSQSENFKKTFYPVFILKHLGSLTTTSYEIEI